MGVMWGGGGGRRGRNNESLEWEKPQCLRASHESILAMWVRVLDRYIILIGVRPGRERS